MKSSTFDSLNREFSAFPIMRAADTPRDEEVAEAALVLEVVFHDDYIAFLRRFGAAMVGSSPVYGLRPVKVMGARWSVVDVTRWYRDENWPRTEDWYIISEDGFGNPIGVDEAGRVKRFDHDSCEEQIIADDFERFLVEHCLKSF